MKRWMITCAALVSLSMAGWAQGPRCQGKGGGNRASTAQQQCRRGPGKGNPANCRNAACPRRTAEAPPPNGAAPAK